MVAKERGKEKAEGTSDVVIYKIEVPANRCATPLIIIVALQTISYINHTDYAKAQQCMFKNPDKYLFLNFICYMYIDS